MGRDSASGILFGGPGCLVPLIVTACEVPKEKISKVRVLPYALQTAL